MGAHLPPTMHVEVDEQGIGWEVETVYPNHSTVYSQHINTTRTQLPPVIENYLCQTCGCKTFETIHKVQGSQLEGKSSEPVYGPPSGSKTTTWVISEYHCSNCTAVFREPVNWSKNQPPQIRKPVATEPAHRGIVLENIAVIET